MQTRPSTYRPYADERQVDFGFIFGVVAPEAAATASPSSSAQSSMSQISQTHDEVEEMSAKYGSLEPNLFLLDGTFSVYPDNLPGVQTGWQSSDLSDHNGKFPSCPWIEFRFSKNQSSYGFTLLFDDKLPTDYPAEVITTVYDLNNRQIGQFVTYPDQWLSIVHLPVQNYRRVRFAFVSTKNPYRRVRLCQVRFGVHYQYDRRNSQKASVRQSVSPWAESLPSSEVVTVIDNSDQLYNMINPKGLYAYLQEGQHMDYHLTINGDQVDMGRLYFSEASSEDGGLTAQITFHDWLYVLDDVEYSEGATGTWTLSAAVSALLRSAKSLIVPVFDGALGSEVIRKCIPQNTSCREALRLCAQAARCTCFLDRQNQLRFIRPALSTAVDEWTRDALVEDAQIKVGQLYNVVKLVALDDYVENAEEIVYTAKNVNVDDIERVYEVTNPLVQNGDAVAQWILAWIQRRVTYSARYRGNPALDLLDTVKIHDVYAVNGSALMTSHEFEYDGGLSAEAKAVRG